MPQRAVAGRAPGEVDLALLDPDEPPFAGKLEVGPVEPPHVVAACIDELHLQLVYGCVGAQVERKLVVRWEIDRQGASRGRVGCGATEIDIQPQRRTGGPRS